MLAVLSGPVAAQMQFGVIQGIVVSPDGSPVDGAVVTLLDGLGAPLVSVPSRDGRFRLVNIVPGTYALRADAPPLHAMVPSLEVGAALTMHVDLQLSAVLAEQVFVRGEAGPGATATRRTLGGDLVRRTPARVRSRGLQDAVATTPGWSTEDNGLMHVRGVDDGVLYVIDGVPTYERLDGLFGMAPDPAMIDSVNVLTGYIPPEFGFKSGGVIEVTSAGRTADRWLGTLDTGLATSDARDVSAAAGGPTSRSTALTVGVAAQTSSRFLDPVHPANFHNDGAAVNGGGQLGWALSPESQVNAVGGFGRSDFDVPHGAEQEEAGQDQRQRIRQYWQTVSWQRSWSARTVSQVSAYHRFASSALEGSPWDTPLFADARRTLRRTGALASITHQRGAHVLKAGAEVSRVTLRERFGFAVTDPDEAAEANLGEAVIAFTPESPFRFEQAAVPTLMSIYAQDSIRLSHLTVDLGLRADRSRMLVNAAQVSPRLGASWQWPSTGTTLRASFGRFFQPPQPENLLLASSPQARALSPFAAAAGDGGGDLQPERQSAGDVAVIQRLPAGARVDVSYWHRRVRSVADPNVLLGTTVVFPNTVARGRASGVDLRVDLPRRRGLSAYLSYGHARVVQFGPITGGLFLEDDVVEIGPGTRFTPDHDQRHVGAFGVTYDHDPRGVSLTVMGRHESGTPLEVDLDELDDLRARPGAGLVDFARGRVRPRQVLDVLWVQRVKRSRRLDLTLRAAALNLAGARWAYNFGNPFSGTHFGPGRTIQLGVRVALR